MLLALYCFHIYILPLCYSASGHESSFARGDVYHILVIINRIREASGMPHTPSALTVQGIRFNRQLQWLCET